MFEEIEICEANFNSDQDCYIHTDTFRKCVNPVLILDMN